MILKNSIPRHVCGLSQPSENGIEKTPQARACGVFLYEYFYPDSREFVLRSPLRISKLGV